MSIRTHSRIGALLCILLVGAWPGLGQEKIQTKSYDEAKEAALAKHKLIFVTFQMDWGEEIGRIRSENNSPTGIIQGKIKGAPCMYLIPPGDLGKHCVLLSVRYDAEPYLRSKFYSDDKTAVVLDGFGNELYAEVCKGRERLYPILQALPEDATGYYSLLKELESHPDSLDLKLAMADLCQLYRATTASRRYYAEIIKSPGYAKGTALSDHVGSRVALNAFLDDDFDEAEDLLSEHVKEYPHSETRPMQLFLLTRMSVMKKHKDDAVRYSEMLQNEFPKDQHALWAKGLIDQYKE